MPMQWQGTEEYIEKLAAVLKDKIKAPYSEYEVAAYCLDALDVEYSEDDWATNVNRWLRKEQII